MSQKKMERNLDETEFEACEWYSYSVSFAQHKLLGAHDVDFGTFFSSSSAEKKVEERTLWMKIHTTPVDISVDDSEAGFRFLAFDPSDGSLWYQHAPSMSKISAAVEELNQGLEIEEELLMGHIEDVVKGKRDSVRWRFATERITEHGSLVPSKILGFISFRCLVGKIALDFKFDCQKDRWEVNTILHSLPFAHLIQPLHITTQYLTDLITQLTGIIEKKDKEIEDYKGQGAKVSRKHIATAHFDAEEFKLAHLQNFKPRRLGDLAILSEVTGVETQVKKRFRDVILEEQKIPSTEKDTEDMEEIEDTSAEKDGTISDVPTSKSDPVIVAAPTVTQATSRNRGTAKASQKDGKNPAVSTQEDAVTAAPPKKKRGLF